jgi:hypothetical protein
MTVCMHACTTAPAVPQCIVSIDTSNGFSVMMCIYLFAAFDMLFGQDHMLHVYVHSTAANHTEAVLCT